MTGIETKQGVRVRVGTWSIFNLSVSMFLFVMLFVCVVLLVHNVTMQTDDNLLTGMS